LIVSIIQSTRSVSPAASQARPCGSDDAFGDEGGNGLVLPATILAPVQEVAIDAMPGGPGVEIFDEGVPDLCTFAAGDDEVGHRLAQVVTERCQEDGQVPARLEFAASARGLLAGQQHAIAGLKRPQGDFGRMTQQPAGPAMMMRLAGGQEVRIGREAAQGREMELLEDLRRGDAGFTNLADQFALRLDELVRMGGRQAFHERGVARNLVVEERFCRGDHREAGGERLL
jgi:hypothetical protein